MGGRAVAAASVPPHLRVCVVQDWVAPGEDVPYYWRDDAWPQWSVVEGWTRWREARAKWCAEQGVDPRALNDVYPGRTPPRYEDPALFMDWG